MAFTTSIAVRGFSSRTRSFSSTQCGRRRPFAMVATQAGAASGAKLSQRARDLIGYIRAHKSIFDPGTGFKSQQITLCRKNDTGRMFIPADELETNRHLLPGVQVAEFILENKDRIVEDAAAAVYSQQKSAEDNPLVAEVVVHDLYYILRVVSYAIAVGSPNFIHENNLGMMKSLHAEIELASPARNAGIQSLADATAAGAVTEETIASVKKCFQQVLEFMAL